MAIFIRWLMTGLSLLILADALVSFVLDPFHPVRRTLDSIMAPFLAPIRRVVPPVGMLDFSPFILLVAVQVLGGLFIRFLSPG
jgi:YggT family protein